MNKQKLIKIGVIVAIVVVLFIAYRKISELIGAKKGFPTEPKEPNVLDKLLGKDKTQTPTNEPNAPAPKDEPIKVGSKLYPLSAPVNIRSSAEVDNGFIGNQIGDPVSGELGEVISQEEGKDGRIWYKIKLTTPVNTFLSIRDYTKGYVRSDVVTNKKPA